MIDPIIAPRPSRPVPIELSAFREVLGTFASGVTVISSQDHGEPIGFTCQSFYSVSLEPPLVSFSVMRTSQTYPRMRTTRRFVINVLSHDQQAVSNQFAKSGSDKWSGVSWHASRHGMPIINGTLAWFDCELYAEHEAGDHYVVIGHVRDMGIARREEPSPLLFFQGKYRDLAG